MTKIELLTEYYEKEWTEAKERSELLDQMLQEERDSLEIKRTAEEATPDGSAIN